MEDKIIVYKTTYITDHYDILINWKKDTCGSKRKN